MIASASQQSLAQFSDVRVHQSHTVLCIRFLFIMDVHWRPACKNWVMRCWHGYLSGEGTNDLRMVQLMPFPPDHLLLH